MAAKTWRKASAVTTRRFGLVRRAILAVGVVALFAGAEAEAEPNPVWQRLDPLQKAKVLAALAGFVILGIALMFLAWLGAKATRRYMNREPRLLKPPPPGTPIREKDWAEKPLASPFEEDETD